MTEKAKLYKSVDSLRESLDLSHIEDLPFLSRREQTKRGICIQSVNDMELFCLCDGF